MMEALGSYGRPFHQRGKEMALGPLNPAEVGEMLRLDPAAAFDAALVTGDLPLICASWRHDGAPRSSHGFTSLHTFFAHCLRGVKLG
ncbi:hypothetical protein FB565_005315 [Actinoplanes lutulentus]|uniref:Uncharacterized protein n=1 Tax=Actinoplanes lutulentus TaxID=1287878 RepID=A0A327ZGL4_9ACTN|nr:hypothetical protein [Actinoplanes lutulentus]MBB2945582.1 hypothetical protein [Actinoplanes lutulentus]RAK40286.1 hypothetical protein B0I29_103318 [Actinoplanes lutulentus]